MRKIKRVGAIMLLLCLTAIIGGCGTAEESKILKMATKPMTEQFILSEMIKEIIEENTDLKVEITKGIGGGTSNIHPAIVKGDFDLYPEYTGTSWNFVLKEKRKLEDDKLFKELNKKYEEDYNLKWVGLYGFENNFGLVIRKDLAEKYNIKTYSDLAKYSKELVFGAEYDFYEREDGYKGLCDTYGLKFKKAIDLDIGLKHKAINEKKIDVMNVFTTDGQLTTSDVVILKDDKSFYNTYYCGTIIRKEILNEYPELEEVLMKMDGIINEEEMAKLNYEVEGNGKDEGTVAKDFLREKGIIK
ncbi:glycine betaine ABC transporter substrate-binding protein [uncultured Clostridium sp.]|uniref:glycine betaine ABC transporter substrate-binding protein n=1 Tax=uncultured Clostridium sp. TaxID=59620 RepID=UPI0026081F19|nr:glycine betaine ABC transporter substrate-binding protein [uncultured Clostridium sp.]